MFPNLLNVICPLRPQIGARPLPCRVRFQVLVSPIFWSRLARRFGDPGDQIFKKFRAPGYLHQSPEHGLER
jgi:hypothetical protein